MKVFLPTFSFLQSQTLRPWPQIVNVSVYPQITMWPQNIQKLNTLIDNKCTDNHVDWDDAATAVMYERIKERYIKRRKRYRTFIISKVLKSNGLKGDKWKWFYTEHGRDHWGSSAWQTLFGVLSIRFLKSFDSRIKTHRQHNEHISTHFIMSRKMDVKHTYRKKKQRDNLKAEETNQMWSNGQEAPKLYCKNCLNFF